MAMHRLRRLMIVPVAVLGTLLAPAAAHADASFDPSGFRLTSSALTVNENAGQAVITIERTDTSEDAQIRYITLGDGVPCGHTECTAVDPDDFTSVKGELDFPVGVASETFTMPIVDHGVQTVPKTIQVSLFGPSPIGMASPSKAVLTILDNDPVTPRDPLNPLALPVAPGAGNPLSGANFFVDPESEAAHAALTNPALDVIAREPGTARFGKFSFGSNGVPEHRHRGLALSRARAGRGSPAPCRCWPRTGSSTATAVTGPTRRPTSPRITTSSTGSPPGIGSYRAVLFLEMDSIITMPCLSPHGQAVREAELRDAINIAHRGLPHLVIYLDAGAADALPLATPPDSCGRRASRRSRASSSTPPTSTGPRTRSGTATRSRASREASTSWSTPARTARVRCGPRDIVHAGLEVLCNPPGRGLGPLPTANTGYRNVDMFAWTSNPGESGGSCVAGAPPTGEYWPAYAAMLVQNADFNVR